MTIYEQWRAEREQLVFFWTWHFLMRLGSIDTRTWLERRKDGRA
jgi:hypothetical protein